MTSQTTDEQGLALMPSVLFVCTGNICRSPMAEVLFKEMLARSKPNGEWHVGSAGVAAYEGFPASEYAQRVMRRRGLRLNHHRSQPVSEKLLRSFNLILTMERFQRDRLRAEFPQMAGKIFMISEMLGKEEDVEDPMGGSLEDYEAVAGTLEAYLENGYKTILRLASNRKSST